MEFDRRHWQTLETGPMRKAVIGGVRDRRERLQHLARSHLHAKHEYLWNYAEGGVLDGNAAEVQKLLKAAGVEIPSALEVDDSGAIYHVVSSEYMTINVAEHLWESGFRDVNFSTSIRPTPLELIFQVDHKWEIGVSLEEYITRQSDLALWLRSRSGLYEESFGSMNLACILAANLGELFSPAFRQGWKPNYYWGFRFKDQKKTSEIREEHAESIELFETILLGLIAEHWASGMDLVSWLDGPLGKRVEEILAAERVVDEEYREDVFKRTGVRLKTAGNDWHDEDWDSEDWDSDDESE
ncbi:hypothetical protein LTR37_002544 [Vermiconidia calcicola]|uniref:Uncharacterized protein n=1 Tax=Vermiconidia calcicola TaxID=1690605 RepID=A0ACC3NTP5_9PEZI|nr:hypothetical protein LTR37_002544 [Vermiconidia calcicola]